MRHGVIAMQDFTVGATDGEIGQVKDVYFDDEHWTIRYMVVDTGGWLSGRKVLISPRSVREVDWDDEVIHVKLSQRQVRQSPGIDTDRPVSRQHEIDHANHYGYPMYWDGSNPWGLGFYPIPWVGASADAMLPSRQPSGDAIARRTRQRRDREHAPADAHLRSSREVIGYEIVASDGPIGNVDDFVFDDGTWAIRDVVVDTRKRLPGKHVLLSAKCIDSISWSEREVYLNVTRETVETSPQYDPSLPLPRQHEAA